MGLHVVGKCGQMCADGKQTRATTSFNGITEAKQFFIIICAKKYMYFSALVQNVGDQINQLTVYLKNSEATLNVCGGAVLAIKWTINVKVCFIVWNTVWPIIYKSRKSSNFAFGYIRLYDFTHTHWIMYEQSMRLYPKVKWIQKILILYNIILRVNKRCFC